MSAPNLPSRNDFLNSCIRTVDGCDICLEPFGPQHLPAQFSGPQYCKHIFGEPCLREWVYSANENANRCPVCRCTLFQDAEPFYFEDCDRDTMVEIVSDVYLMVCLDFLPPDLDVIIYCMRLQMADEMGVDLDGRIRVRDESARYMLILLERMLDAYGWRPPLDDADELFWGDQMFQMCQLNYHGTVGGSENAQTTPP